MFVMKLHLGKTLNFIVTFSTRNVIVCKSVLQRDYIISQEVNIKSMLKTRIMK